MLRIQQHVSLFTVACCLVHLIIRFDEYHKGNTDNPLIIDIHLFPVTFKKKIIKLFMICFVIYSIVNDASKIKFTYRNDDETDFLFQVNNNKKMRNVDQKQCWSKMFDLS